MAGSSRYSRGGTISKPWRGLSNDTYRFWDNPSDMRAMSDIEPTAEGVRLHRILRKLMRVFTYMWSTLFLLNAGLVISIAWIALASWNAGTLNAAAVATPPMVAAL